MGFEAYTTTDPDYKGRDAVTFVETPRRFHSIYCHESAGWQFQMNDIEQPSFLGFFYVNVKFDKAFTPRIVDELNRRGRRQIKQILKEIFEPPQESD